MTNAIVQNEPQVKSSKRILALRSNYKKQLNIAMIGQKGIPATYGGIEHHVENLGRALTKLGHKVTVYCRPYYSKDLEKYEGLERESSGRYKFNGIKMRILPSIKTKHLDAISHSALSAIIGSMDDFDIIHIHGIGPSLVSFIPRSFGKKVIATIHALDYRQEKWGAFAKGMLKAGLNAACHVPHKTICVTKTILESIDKSSRVVVIPNGVKEPLQWGYEEYRWICDSGLIPGNYILFVGRLIKDKNCHQLIKAVKELKPGIRLAVAGSSSFTDGYVKSLKAEAGEETIFLGSVYNERLSALYHNCALFVLPSVVEGLPLVVLEAMIHRAPVLVSDIPENLEIIYNAADETTYGSSFVAGDLESLKARIEYILNNREELQGQIDLAYEHVLAEYSWDRIAKLTEKAYFNAMINDPVEIIANSAPKRIYIKLI